MTRRLLQVEELPRRDLASATPLSGHAAGVFTNLGFRIDVGPFYSLTGKAVLHTVGRAELQGSLEGASIDGPHQAVLGLALRNTHGMIFVDLEGPHQNGFAPLPSTFRYDVIRGTGAYIHVHDHGSAVLHLIPASTAQAVLPLHHEVGTFTLTLRSKA